MPHLSQPCWHAIPYLQTASACLAIILKALGIFVLQKFLVLLVMMSMLLQVTNI